MVATVRVVVLRKERRERCWSEENTTREHKAEYGGATKRLGVARTHDEALINLSTHLSPPNTPSTPPNHGGTKHQILIQLS